MTDSLEIGHGSAQVNEPITEPAHGRLSAFAEYIQARAVRKHILFMLMATTVVLLYGYYLGTFDQSLHIPELKKFADPTLYPNDGYLDLRFQHYSYFWLLFVPFYRLGILEITVFLVHLLVLYSTVWAFWELSDTLFHNPLTNLLSLAAFVLPHIGFGGWPIFEWSLLNRTFVLPFLLLAMIMLIRGRIFIAFGLLGLTYNLHALSVNFALALILFACLVEGRRIGWQKIAGSLAIFIICALPVLIWKLSGPGGDLNIDLTWYSVVSLGMVYNNYALFSTQPDIILATLSGIGTLCLFIIGRRAGPADSNLRLVNLFLVATLTILAVQFIVMTWLPITIFIEFQLLRVGVWATIFGFLYFSNYLATRYSAKAPGRANSNLLTISFLFSILPFVPVLVAFVERLAISTAWRRILFLAVGVVPTAIAYVLLYGILFGTGSAGPGIHVYPPQTEWNDVQFWARDHTPKDTLFIAPPHIWWFYIPDWRVFSERSTVVTFSELLEIAFSPNYLNTWLHRFNELAPGAVARFRGDPIENERIVAQAFYSLTSEDFTKVACEYHAAYLVVEKPHSRNFDVAYENAGFIVYALPRDCPTALATHPWTDESRYGSRGGGIEMLPGKLCPIVRHT